VHLASAGLGKLRIQLEGVKSLAEFEAHIRARLADFKPGEWIIGRGWDHTLWPENRFPTRADLDAISRDHPMFFERVDGHVAVVNSRALEIAGIGRSTPDPPAGKFVRDPKTGEPNGMLEEDSAMNAVRAKIPAPLPDEQRRAIELALAEVARFGVTSIQDNSPWNDFLVYRQLHREGKLTARISEWLDFQAPLDLLESQRREGGRTDPWLKTGALKGFMDGSLGSRTAAMLAPYSDSATTSGILRIPAEELKRQAIERDRAGFQIALHAIGDRANRVALDAFAAVAAANGPRDRRDRIEHAQIVAPEDLPRFASLGVIASMEPSHLLDDQRWVASRIGPGRFKGAYAWNSLAKSGAHLAFGTDYPVESVDPLRGLYSCVTRELPEGGPVGGWEKQEALPLEDCVRQYTAGAAYAEFEETRKGRLAPGMLADIVVFPTDITHPSPRELLQAKVATTIIGGRVVFDAAAH